MNSHLSFLPAAVLFFISQSYGEVVLQDVYASTAPEGAPTDLGGGVFGYEFNLDSATEFSAAGHGKLVASFTFHDGEAFASAPTVSRVLYNGVELTEAVNSRDNWALVAVGVYYLDNVVADGTLRFEMTEASAPGAQFGFSVFALDGLVAGVQATGSAPNHLQSEATVSISTDQGFFVQEAARNNQSLGDDELDDYTTLYNFNLLAYRGLSQYQVTSAPGDYLAPINNGGANAGRFATAAFEAGPSGAVELAITSITSLGSNVFELTLTGKVETNYQLISSPTLDFSAGITLENLSQGDPGDAGSVGGVANEVLTTDADGNAKVRATLAGTPADFLRAEEVSGL